MSRAALFRPWPVAIAIALICTVASLAAWAAGPPQVSWRLDFGAHKAPATSGWQRVSPEARSGAGARPGFDGATKALEPIRRGQKWLHPLVRHGVRLHGRLQIPLPAGRYAVWLLAGGAGQDWLTGFVNDVRYELKAEGLSVRTGPPVAAVPGRIVDAFYRHWDRVYRRGDDPWELKIVPLFQQHVVEVQVDDGALTIYGGRVQLRALAIEPLSRRRELAAAVLETWQALRHHFVAVADPQEGAPPWPGRAANAAERQSGLQLWRQSVMVPTLPGSRPPATGEPQPSPIRIARGGRAVVVVGIRALKTLKSPRLQVRAVDAHGQAAPVRLRTRRLLYNWDKDARVQPSHLLPVAVADVSGGLPDPLPGGQTQAIWIDVWPHPKAAAQTVHVEVALQAAGAKVSLRVPVQLLPWSLVPVHQAGQFVLTHARPSVLASHLSSMFPKAWQTGRPKVQAHLAALGFLPNVRELNGQIHDIEGPAPQIKVPESDVARFINDVDLHRQAFPGVPVTVTMHYSIAAARFPVRREDGAPSLEQPPAFFRAMRMFVQLHEKLRKRRPNWPTFRYILSAEPSNRGEKGVERSRRLLAAIRPLGVEVIAVLISPRAVDVLRPMVDIIGINRGVPGLDPNVTDLPDAAARRWVYQAHNRLGHGFFAARHSATGGFAEFYQQAQARAFNNFDGDELELGGVALPIPGGVASTPRLERMALGIEDLRTIETLRRASRRARRSRDPRLRARGDSALDLLATTLASVEPDTRHQRSVLGPWAPEAYAVLRRRLERAIEALLPAD